jgi:HNH endonuclease
MKLQEAVMAGHETHAELPGFGPATTCEASGSHSPTPLRFVWHHIQPQEAGGATVSSNLAQLCDSCHYSIHRLLYHLAKGVALGPVPRKAQLALAQQGYAMCVNAGTVDKIPNEG